MDMNNKLDIILEMVIANPNYSAQVKQDCESDSSIEEVYSSTYNTSISFDKLKKGFRDTEKFMRDHELPNKKQQQTSSAASNALFKIPIKKEEACASTASNSLFKIPSKKEDTRASTASNSLFSIPNKKEPASIGSSSMFNNESSLKSHISHDNELIDSYFEK